MSLAHILIDKKKVSVAPNPMSRMTTRSNIIISRYYIYLPKYCSTILHTTYTIRLSYIIQYFIHICTTQTRAYSNHCIRYEETEETGEYVSVTTGCCQDVSMVDKE